MNTWPVDATQGAVRNVTSHEGSGEPPTMHAAWECKTVGGEAGVGMFSGLTFTGKRTPPASIMKCELGRRIMRCGAERTYNDSGDPSRLLTRPLMSGGRGGFSSP